MSLLARPQHLLSSEQSAESRTGIDIDAAMREDLWFMDAEFDGSHQDLSFHSSTLGKGPARKDSLNNLRINTYPKADLPERYNSDEEEQSASPDSETASAADEDDEEEDVKDDAEEELKHKSAVKAVEEESDFVIYEDCTAEVAVAVPIMILGPPKLIDITNLAPIQRRKRAINHPTLQRSAMKNAVALASRSPALSDSGCNSNLPAPSRSAPSVPSNESAPQSKVSTPVTEHLPRRQDSLPDLTRSIPDSWLPEENGDMILESVDEQDDLYFPALDVRPSPTYNDYDPYSLHPPSLSPSRNSHISKNSPKSPAFPSPLLKKQPGSVARARKASNPPNVANNGAWKGLTRTLSMAKRQEAIHPQAKKPKMIARGATEREELPSIPPFPFEEKLGNRVMANTFAGSATALSLRS